MIGRPRPQYHGCPARCRRGLAGMATRGAAGRAGAPRMAARGRVRARPTRPRVGSVRSSGSHRTRIRSVTRHPDPRLLVIRPGGNGGVVIASSRAQIAATVRARAAARLPPARRSQAGGDVGTRTRRRGEVPHDAPGSCPRTNSGYVTSSPSPRRHTARRGGACPPGHDADGVVGLPARHPQIPSPRACASRQRHDLCSAAAATHRDCMNRAVAAPAAQGDPVDNRRTPSPSDGVVGGDRQRHRPGARLACRAADPFVEPTARRAPRSAVARLPRPGRCLRL